MTATLALLALGTWGYAGFLTEPAPTPKALRPPTPPAVARREAPPSRPAAPPTKPRPAPAPPVPPTPPAPPAPRVYRLLDARGQAWDHPDPAFLRGFIRDRNLSISAQSPPAPSCVGGRCR